jgi:ribbon-helix-helix CopG family protein
LVDILIREVPEDVVAAIDAKAAKLGLSRAEYLRRSLASSAKASSGPVTAEDLDRFATRFPDLGDSEVMRRAW